MLDRRYVPYDTIMSTVPDPDGDIAVIEVPLIIVNLAAFVVP